MKATSCLLPNQALVNKYADVLQQMFEFAFRLNLFGMLLNKGKSLGVHVLLCYYHSSHQCVIIQQSYYDDSLELQITESLYYIYISYIYMCVFIWDMS